MHVYWLYYHLTCTFWLLQVSNKGAMADAEKYAKYTQNNTITEKTIVDAPYHSTLCSTCQTVCHDRCGLAEISTPGKALNEISSQWIMNTSMCRGLAMQVLLPLQLVMSLIAVWTWALALRTCSPVTSSCMLHCIYRWSWLWQLLLLRWRRWAMHAVHWQMWLQRSLPCQEDHQGGNNI